MKAAKITVAGTTYFLVMDGEAMFTIRDIYGGTRLMLEKMEQDTREGFLETCNAAAILAERGELVRRRLGYEPGRIPERDDFALLTQPYEIVPLKRAIANAIKLGYGREITAPGDDEVDEGLEELNQKKNKIRRADYYRIAVLCGISPADALFMPPGEVFDLWELYLIARGKSNNGEGN